MAHFILVLNSGSSSFKFSLFPIAQQQLHSQQPTVSGLAEKLGSPKAELHWRDDAGKTSISIANATHAEAIEDLLKRLTILGIDANKLVAIGHRVVHGGEKFSTSVLIDEHVIANIAHCNDLAPLHNPANLLGIRIIRQLYPQLPQVAVFDTAFHQTMPPKAYLYAIPYKFYRELGIRRYGFHGTSHRYVTQQAITQLKLSPQDNQLLIAHLGNGCSATAIRNGKSVDTSMGLTPLEGLVMGTRSGDVDPSLHHFLHEKRGLSLEEITRILNNESGLLGLSELSNDMRSLIEAAPHNAQAVLAIEVFCFRLARQLAGLAASLTRIDALVFTGGIGENAPLIRAKVIEQLSIFGFQLDPVRNQYPEFGDTNTAIITAPQSTTAIVIKTNEEWMIAKDCLNILTTKMENN